MSPHRPRHFRRPDDAPGAALLAAASLSPSPSLSRLVEAPGFLPSLLHVDTDDDDDAGREDGGGPSGVVAASSLGPVPLSNLFALLGREVERGRNVDAVLGFVERVLTRRWCEGRRGGGCASLGGREDAGRPVAVPEEEEGEGWVRCSSFMVAYDALARRVPLDRRSEKESGTDAEGVDAAERQEEDVEGAEGRGRVEVALRVMDLSRRGTRCGESSSCSSSVVGRCFGPQLSLVDSYVRDREERRRVRRRSDAGGDIFGAACLTLGRAPGRKRRREEQEEVEVEDLFDDFNDVESEGGESSTRSNEDPAEALAKADRRSPSRSPSPSQKAVETSPKPSASSSSGSPSSSVPPVDGGKEPPPARRTTPEWERTASEVRSSLLELPPAAGYAATSSAVRSLSDRIARLLDAAGSDAGADGLRIAGTILSHGRASPPPPSSSSDANDGGAVAARNGNGRGTTAIADVLLGDVAKSVVTESASSIRTVAFLESFAYPVVRRDVVDDGGRTPSRVLTTFLTALARDRPAECIDSILVPIILDSSSSSAGGEGGEKGGGGGGGGGDGTTGPSRHACDLVSRIVKGKNGLPKEYVPRLLRGLLLGQRPSSDRFPGGSGMNGEPGMAWTDCSVAVVTSCLHRKSTLPDDVVRAIVARSGPCAKTMGRSVKFSTLVHSLVVNYGDRLLDLGWKGEMVQVADGIKTFMGKTIKSALMRLK